MESPRKLHSICQINFTIERINKVSRGNFTQHLFFFVFILSAERILKEMAVRRRKSNSNSTTLPSVTREFCFLSSSSFSYFRIYFLSN